MRKLCHKRIAPIIEDKIRRLLAATLSWPWLALGMALGSVLELLTTHLFFMFDPDFYAGLIFNKGMLSGYRPPWRLLLAACLRF